MKNSKLTLSIAALALSMAVAVISCKKKDTTPPPAAPDTETGGANDMSLAENNSNDVVAIGAEATDNTSGSLGSYKYGDQTLLTGCATVTRDSVHRIDTVKFNGLACLDGKIRSGMLIFTYSSAAKHYRDPGFSLTVTSYNYVVNSNSVTITHAVTNTTVGTPSASNPETWSISGNVNIVKASGGTVSWTCSRTKTLLNTGITYTNAATPINWPMARIGITGSASGTRANGETFTITVTSQLIRDFGACNIAGQHPFIQGTFDYAPSGKAVRHFDYGTGTCDLNATVTINNITYNITLP